VNLYNALGIANVGVLAFESSNNTSASGGNNSNTGSINASVSGKPSSGAVDAAGSVRSVSSVGFILNSSFIVVILLVLK
jgi:hypothetical protein